MIKFSIITVCLNAGDELIETVASTLHQTYENIEIIVKDGLSKDGSLKKLPEDSRIKLVCKKDNGIYDAMNQAVDEASGEYLIFMNCGDRFYDETTLEKIAGIVCESESLCYYGLCFNRKMNHVNAYPHTVSPLTCYRTMICHQSIVYSKSLFDEHKYDTSFKILADKEYLMWMVCKKKTKMTYMDLIVVDYKAEGACEDPKYADANRNDLERMKRVYYSPLQLWCYRIIHNLTLPGVRKRITHNKRLSNLYYTILKIVYNSGK